MKQYRNLAVLVLAVLLVLSAACSREAKQTAGVRSTTPQGTSTAPPSSQADQQNMAMVRFVNAIPNGPAVDAWAGDKKVFTDVRSSAVTPYKEMPKERVEFRLTASGEGNPSSQPIATNSEGLSAGHHYTIIAMAANDNGGGMGRHNTADRTGNRREDTGTANDNRADKADRNANNGTANNANNANENLKLVVLDDNLTPPPQGKARLRVVNAAPGAGDVTLWADNIVSRGTETAVGRGVGNAGGSSTANNGNDNARGNDVSGNTNTAPDNSGTADRNANRHDKNAKTPEKLLSGVDYASGTHYKDVDPMNATIEIRSDRAGNRKDTGKHERPVESASAATVRDMTFDPGKIYTIVVTREQNGNLQALRIEDEFTGAGTETSGGTGR